MNPYDILGVSRDATNEEIKAAFRSLAQKYHPDKGGDEETFINIKLAYDVLSDPFKRQQYDQTGLFNGKRTRRDEAIHELNCLLNWLINHFDFENDNLVTRLNFELDKAVVDLNNRKKNIQRSIEILTKAANKTRNKFGRKNLLEGSIRQRLEMAKSEIKPIDDKLEVIKIVRTLIEEHEYL